MAEVFPARLSLEVGRWWHWLPRWSSLSRVYNLTWLCFGMEVVSAR